MKEHAVWPFLFGMLSVYPFFPLRHVPVMDHLKIPFWKLMLFATAIMLVQGFSYLWMSEQYAFNSSVLAWHRKLFMIPYVLLTLAFSKDSKSKTLFMDFFMVGIVMAVIDFAYVIERTWFVQAFSAAPHRTDVLVRGALTLLIYPPLYFLFKRVLRPVMQIQSMSVWRYMTAIPFAFAVTSIITTMEAFGHEISPVILAIRISIIGGSVLVCALLGKVIQQMQEAVIAQEKSKQAERLLALQGAQYKALSKNIEQTKATRHDLRHQLTVIRNYSERADRDKLTAYLDTLMQEIPDQPCVEYCENATVNAIVSHYAALAEKSGITLSIKLTVPEETKRISDTSLCVIFGNLLENAIEACDRMTEGERFIRLYSRLQYQTLTITIDNSFDGVVNTKDDKLISRKNSDFGIGTVSVTVVAEKHGGDAHFEADGMVFKASVYVQV